MGIESELMEFLVSTIKDGVNKDRDIEIIKFYYGLNESSWPTLEDTAARFEVGTRERIRQLINTKFRDNVKKESIPSLNKFVQLLQTREFWSFSEFEKEVYSSGLIDVESHLKGVFNLIADVKIDCDFEFYNSVLKLATRKSIVTSEEMFLIKKSNIKAVKNLLKKAQDLPSRCGIANLNYLSKELGKYYLLISALIKNSPTSWVKSVGNDYWYIFENRDNTIINYSEKVFSTADYVDSIRLAVTYKNALDGRSYKYPYPPIEIIEEYLRSSVYMLNTNNGLKFIGETKKLNKIEEDLMFFFNHYSKNASFPDLCKHLTNEGHGRPYSVKTINCSPLIYVDKTRGRKRYTYSPVGHSIPVQYGSSDVDTYELYLYRLRALLNVGTDEAKEQIVRKEQRILQEWLFKDKTHENCAICGLRFSIKTLVTAHKKPRSGCNDAERLDPYIVMPVCLTGCDYFYENMYIYIEGSEIKQGLSFLNAETEVNLIENLVGRKVDPKWLLGNKSYFRSPDKVL